MAGRIIIVEDENVVAMDLRASLTALGYQVTGVAATGREALALAADLATRPELVLMDIHLRGVMDGVEAAQRLQDDHGLPVVYLTAFADAATRSRALQSDPFGYLIKPFDDRELQITVELALHRSRLDHERRRLEAEKTARALAEEAVRIRDEFLSIASHELKTPLTSLQLQIESLQRIVQRESDARAGDKVQRKLTAVAGQVERLTALVANLLDVSRLGAGKLELVLAEVALGDVVREVAARLADQAERAGATLTLAIDERVRGVWDPMRLDQVVTNLVSNALKYGAGKPVELGVSWRGGLARLEVRDHGIGIAPVDAERIFARFERAVSAQHYGGLGLGLYITRQLVHAHGGTVVVESTLGEGACFVVELPGLHDGDGEDAGAV